jgi:hypothetical protein
VFRAYDTSKLYRELKLRAAIIKDKLLVLLPKEAIYNKASRPASRAPSCARAQLASLRSPPGTPG